VKCFSQPNFASKFYLSQKRFMALVEKFYELEVWKLSRELENRIYLLSKRTSLSSDFALKDQMNKSTGSIMDNIAEGFGRTGRVEFIQFLSISRGSACELQSQLIRSKDRGYISEVEFDECFQLANFIVGKIVNLMKHLNNTKMKGAKFLGRGQKQ
jgi:four helix bundle protein